MTVNQSYLNIGGQSFSCRTITINKKRTEVRFELLGDGNKLLFLKGKVTPLFFRMPNDKVNMLCMGLVLDVTSISAEAFEVKVKLEGI